MVAQRLKWDYYQQRVQDVADTTSKLRQYPPTYFFPQGEPPQMPAVYSRYLQCKAWHKLWWPGGLADQPYLLMQEFDACRAGEQEFAAHGLPYIEKYDHPPAQGAPQHGLSQFANPVR